MANEKLDELKQEAKELGIDFSANIGVNKLQEKIDAHYESQETSGAEIEAAVEAIEEAEEAKIEEAKVDDKKSVVKGKKGPRTMQDRIADAKANAYKTTIVTVIDNDQRVNNQTTTCTVNCSNEYFDLGTRAIPLNERVELEQGFIDTLREVRIPQHVKDNTTGLSKVVMRPRYTIA